MTKFAKEKKIFQLYITLLYFHSFNAHYAPEIGTPIHVPIVQIRKLSPKRRSNFPKGVASTAFQLP